MTVIGAPTLASLLGGVGGDLPVTDRAIDRLAMAHDASHYLLSPEVVVTPRTAKHVADILGVARRAGAHLTFRSGGTSLSGQAGSSSILVDTRRHFRGVEVLDDGERVRVEPGVTVRTLNARLAPHRRKFGPDPASEGACTVGGVIANNSSGMACGTEFNAFHTLESLVAVLPSGTVVDTSQVDAEECLRALEPELYRGLALLRDRVRSDADSLARIRQQYSMKNTMGYSVNAFVHSHRIVDILAHLLVGSEGTLAFVSSAVFRTLPLKPKAATGFLVFATMGAATDAIAELTAAGASTIELLDAASLRVSQRNPIAAPTLGGVHVEAHAALLVEMQADTDEELAVATSGLASAISRLPVGITVPLSTVAAERASMWTLRKGLYTAVAGARPPGTTALLEDIVVPVRRLTETTRGLDELFARHSYPEAVTFGHAKDGNLHFMISPRLDDPRELARYEAFTEDLVDLVLDQGGSLKAEHGTGRIMAPYVERQFGTELYGVMREVKRLFDPDSLLNPGVIITDNPREHLENLKTVPSVSPAVDACVDCGYCEPVCPSRDVTTTPRQRIAIMREMVTADEATLAELERDFDYAAVDTCAADSLCVTACPVFIDTGKVMKGLRAERRGPAVQATGAAVAKAFAPTVGAVRLALGVAEHIPTPVLAAATRAGRAIVGDDWVPLAGSDLPGPGPRRRGRVEPRADVVLFVTCVGSMFAPEGKAQGATAAFLSLCAKAGVGVAVPEQIGGLCCGTPWQSKGLVDGHRAMASRTFDALWEATRGGELPVVSDASSCSQGLRELRGVLPVDSLERFDRLRIVDAVTYVREVVLDRLAVPVRMDAMALHPTCSTVHLDANADLLAVAQAVAVRVDVPVAWGCCGFAGDRGMLHPELAASASRAEADEVLAGDYDVYASCNRTCELGMSRATGKTYNHVIEILDSLAIARP